MTQKLFNYEIATIAEALYAELEMQETARRSWAYSLYYVLVKYYGNTMSLPEWEERYKQWNVDHMYRGALSKKNNLPVTPLYTIDTCKKTDKGLSIQGKLTGPRDMELKVNITHQDFADLTNPALNEAHRLLVEEEVDQIIRFLGEITQKENLLTLEPRITSLWKMVNELRKVYREASKEEKEFLETVIGAAIFYLPHPVNECFNGYCSLNALNRAFKEKGLVKEHLFPRKRAGKALLVRDYTMNEFYQKVKDEFRIFMYLTAEENKLTINYEGTHDEELARLAIPKFPQGENSVFYKKHTLFKNFVCWARPKVKNSEVSMEEAEELFRGFMEGRERLTIED